MYPFGDLPGNLTAFCAVLRHDHGFRIGPGELRDAARALEVVNLADDRMVRDALRLVLSSSLDTAAAFDKAFDRFFFPGPQGVPQSGLPRVDRRERPPHLSDPGGERSRPTGDPRADLDPDPAAGAPDAPVVMDDDAAESEERAVRLARASYSPLAAVGRTSLELVPASAAWREAGRAFLRQLHLGLSRRWRPGPRGRRFDLRRTWRASLQTGGEALTARWLRRVHRTPRLVMLIDGSRSMGAAQRPALALAVALASVTRRLDVFVFSTALTTLTREVRLAAAGHVVRVELDRETWGGGTSIGDSLRAFLRRHGERRVGRDTLVVIVSDGLDVGAPGRLGAAMRELHRRAAGVIWLNPLLATPGYQPISRGMVAARPSITTLANVSSAHDLTQLARLVRLR